ncbi:MAG: TraR/DksA C4-type zinc finger protein [Actinomycetia bacterium]|nr:TraR/DksA C4-type zinc finger protein [Actinomycetes bacterium]
MAAKGGQSAALRTRLEALVDRLSGLADSRRAELAAPRAGGGELSHYDNHPADQATATAGRALDAGIVRGLESRLHEARRALAKLEAGTYGRCDRCGRPIEAGRLAVRPESVLCRACAAAAPPWTPGPDPGPPPDETAFVAATAYGSSDGPQDVPPAVDYDQTHTGFADPEGAVEPVEAWVDAGGDAVFDAVRSAPREAGKATARQESDDPGPGTASTP